MPPEEPPTVPMTDEAGGLPESRDESPVDDFSRRHSEEESLDGVRVYLNASRTTPLLTREGEARLAKAIEDGDRAVMDALVRVPRMLDTILERGARIGEGFQELKQVVQIRSEESDPVQRVRRQLQQLAGLRANLDRAAVASEIENERLRKRVVQLLERMGLAEKPQAGTYRESAPSGQSGSWNSKTALLALDVSSAGGQTDAPGHPPRDPTDGIESGRKPDRNSHIA